MVWYCSILTCVTDVTFLTTDIHNAIVIICHYQSVPANIDCYRTIYNFTTMILWLVYALSILSNSVILILPDASLKSLNLFLVWSHCWTNVLVNPTWFLLPWREPYLYLNNIPMTCNKALFWDGRSGHEIYFSLLCHGKIPQSWI